MSKEKSQLKIGIILGYVNELVGNLIPIFYTPIMMSLLGTGEYGLYKISSSVTSYLSLISMGIGSAVSRYIIKAGTEEGKEAEERILGLFMIIFQIITALTLVVGTALTMNLHLWYGSSLTVEELQRMKIIVFIMVCNTALSFQLSPYISVVSAHERYVFFKVMGIISTCLGPLCNLAVLYMGYGSVGMAASSLAVGVVTRFVYLYYVRRKMKIKARYEKPSKDVLKDILTFSFWIFVGDIVGKMYSVTDTVMIGMVPGLATEGAAVYHVGSMFNGIVLGLTVGISGLMTPKANKMVFSGATKQELTDLCIRVGRLQGLIILLLVTGFIVFGQPAIYFYMGEGFEDAYWVAVCMMIPNMIPLVQAVCLSIITAQNKHKFRSLVYLGIAILNVIGTWFLMHTPLGIIGAALMTGIALILGQGFVMNWYYWKKTDILVGRFWKELSKIYIIPIILCVAALFVKRYIDLYHIGVLFAGIVLYTVVYCACMWRFTMNDYEKSLILEPMKKIFKKKKQAGE